MNEDARIAILDTVLEIQKLAERLFAGGCEPDIREERDNAWRKLSELLENETDKRMM